MFQPSTRQLTGLALMLLLSLALAACGGETPTATAVPQPTATTAAAAPTDTAAMAAPTNTAAMAAPTATTAMAAPTDTAAMGAPTATTASGSGTGNTGSGQFQDVIANMRALKSYHMDISTSTAGQSVSQSIDVDVANNKLRINSTTAGQSIVILVIGNDSWMSMDGGKTYTPNPAGQQMAQALGLYIHMWDNAGTPGTQTVPTTGFKEGTPPTEQIDGVDTKHYIVDSSDAAVGGAGGFQGTVEYWISTDSTPRIVQMKSKSTAAGQQSDATIKWSKFNEDLGITAP